MSHGHMGEETLKSAKMIIGELKNIQTFSLAMSFDDSVEKVEELIKEALNKLSDCERVVIFADLLGGTPCNLIINQIINNKEKYIVVSGFNLGMVLETLSLANAEIDFEIDDMIQKGKENIVNVSKKLSN